MLDENAAFKAVIGQYDGPAFARRARHVDGALASLLDSSREQREKLLKMVKIHLGLLHALAGEWAALRPLCADDQLQILRDLFTELEPRLRVCVERVTSLRSLRHALAELVESLDTFNRRWDNYLASLDLTSVNELREGYNRWYVLEKEFAVRSPVVARQGFKPLPPLTVEDIRAALPTLPVPRLK
jgi:hypothetical protein